MPLSGELPQDREVELRKFLRSWARDELAIVAKAVRPHLPAEKRGRKAAQAGSGRPLREALNVLQNKIGSRKGAIAEYAIGTGKHMAGVEKALSRAKNRNSVSYRCQHGIKYTAAPSIALHLALSRALPDIFPELVDFAGAHARLRAWIECLRRRALSHV
jgi:hypothetical protein